MGGYQQLVRGEPFRGKFRHSFEKPEPFTPGKVEEINATFQDVNHTFRRGHRIMVQVQSSWFPLTDRNPQTFVNIPDAKPIRFREGHRARVSHEGGAVGNWCGSDSDNCRRAKIVTEVGVGKTGKGTSSLVPIPRSKRLRLQPLRSSF